MKGVILQLPFHDHVVDDIAEGGKADNVVGLRIVRRDRAEQVLQRKRQIRGSDWVSYKLLRRRKLG